MSALIAQYGLLIVALVIFAGEVGLPTLVPGEIALLFAGSQVIKSVPALILAILLFGAVDIAATTTIHVISRTGGNRLLKRVLRMVRRDQTPPEQVIDRWRRRLGGYDALVVFVTRMIPMFRLYASISTGLIRIRFRHFLLGAAPAAWLWATTPLTLGFLLRSKIGAVTAQYPTMMRYVILSSILIFAAMAILGWLRHAGSKAAALRRLRFLLGMTAVAGASTRLFTMVMVGPGVVGHHFLIPVLPALATWISVLAVLALALLWLAAHDLRVICTRGCKPGFGMASGAAWLSLVAVLGLATLSTGVHQLAL